MPVTIGGSGPITGVTSINTTVSDTELGYLDGVTSALQTQLGTKANATAVNGPSFSAYHSANQTVTANTWTKMSLNTEEWDTASCYDAVTNYRFTPNVAGYYQVTMAAGGSGDVRTRLYKNGSGDRYGNIASTNNSAVASFLVYLNGSTDYIEMYAYNSSTTIYANTVGTFFQAAFVRAA